MKMYPLALACLLAAPVLAHDHDHHAHVHGVAKLEVAVEGGRIDLHLESPLEALLGFEHAPRSDKERAAAGRMHQALKQADKLFVPTAAAGCKLVSVEVEAPTLEGHEEHGHKANEKHDEHDGHDEHGDLDADFQFTCAQPGKLTGMEVRLADTFPGMRRIDAQVVSGKGQSAARLTAKMRFLSW